MTADPNTLKTETTMRKIVTAAAGLVATAVLLVAPAVPANAAPTSTAACYGCSLSR